MARFRERLPLWPVVIAGVLLGTAPWVVWSDRLPDPIAFHWSVGGPDSSLSRAAGVATFLLAVPVVALIVVMGHRRGWRPGTSTRSTGTAILGFAVFVSLMVFLTNVSESDWTKADLDPWGLLTSAAAGLTIAGLGFFVRQSERPSFA